ncbi:MAG: 5-formyltetrahydrofolate cyclo-ligase [Rhodobacteraceae bacterium]|nr:5-formyltetrahydrofolate cyclo-ligase [Paracoccaceae bacterium]
MTDSTIIGGRYASSPCMAAEIAPDYFDPAGVDPQQAHDVAQWRKSKRAELLARRRALRVDERVAVSTAIVGHLRDFLAERLDGARGKVVSAYWPIKGEPDLRVLMTELAKSGATIALPLVETRAAPLVFRRWEPRMKMVRGNWNILVPPPDAEELVPDITLAPVVGWDNHAFRLGYGGGYFDRTLAALAPRPYTIGIGFQTAKLATIFPQPHDIALDAIITETGHQPTEAPT